MVIQFKVNESKLTLLSNPYVVGNSYNYVNCQFSFSDDWDGIPKTAIFTNGSREYPVTLNVSDQCKVPWEVLAPNQFYISVVGGSPDTAMITTNIISINVYPSTECHRYDNYNCGRNPTPDIYQQILGILQDKQDILVAGDNIVIDENNVISGTTDYIDEKVEELNARINNISIVFDESTNELWLSSGDVQLGFRAKLSSVVKKIIVNESNEMVVTYTDGIEENIGTIGGSGVCTGIYIPSYTDDGVLTFELTDSAAEEKIELDINGNNNWIPIEGVEESSDYYWEEL